MLTVCLSVSIWWLMLALIPLAVLLLAASAVLPQQGKLHDVYERVVRTILFTPIPGVPTLSFIKFVLVGLGVVSAFVGLTVFKDGSRTPLPPTAPLDQQLLFQAKGWRNQRNFYLTCLALALWWSVYVVFSLKATVARLLDERDASRNTNVSVAAPAAAKSASTSSGSAPVRRSVPQPSAPDMEPNTNVKHLD